MGSGQDPVGFQQHARRLAGRSRAVRHIRTATGWRAHTRPRRWHARSRPTLRARPTRSLASSPARPNAQLSPPYACEQVAAVCSQRGDQGYAGRTVTGFRISAR